jgi:hypothetical protein
MSTFTPEQELQIANEVMPSCPGSQKWEMRAYTNGDKYIYSIYFDEWDPRNDDAQWRALTEWCMDKGVSPHEFGARTNNYLNGVGEFKFYQCPSPWGVVTAFTRTDCMKAVVLAYLENKG